MFDKVDIIYGTKDQSRLLFKFQYEMWKKDDIDLHIILEQPDPSWTGPVGFTTKVLEEIVKSRDRSFIDNTYAKVSRLKDMIIQKAPGVVIEVDGGVGFDNASKLVKAGADILVVGNAVFSSADPVKVISDLKSL